MNSSNSKKIILKYNNKNKAIDFLFMWQTNADKCRIYTTLISYNINQDYAIHQSDDLAWRRVGNLRIFIPLMINFIVTQII